MRRVAHVLAPAAYGGLESVVATLTCGQAESGMEVTVLGVFTETPEGEPFWDEMRELPGVTTVPVVIRGRRYREERAKLAELVVESGSEVVHTHGYRPDVLMGGVARRLGLPVVSTVHGFSGGGFKNRAFEWLQRRSLRRYDAVVAVSSKLHRELVAEGVPAERVHRVPNAWTSKAAPLSREEARRGLGLADVDGPVIGWVGRLTPVKAPELMLQALPHLPPDVRLSMIGDGPMRGRLEEMAAQEGLRSRVRLHGVVANAARYLPAFDGLVISSWSEGTPMVLLEAMALDVPIVTTAVGGIPDVVSHREALLVEPGDVHGIGRAVGCVLDDPGASRHRSHAARARLARDFDTSAWVERYREIYDSCAL